MTPGELAWERAEEEWEADVQKAVERIESRALVILVQRGVEAAQRRLRAAEYDLAKALKSVEVAQSQMNSALDTFEEAIRLASRKP